MLASGDPALGHCTSIALRMMFFQQHGKQSAKERGEPEPVEIPVRSLREVLLGSQILDGLLRAPVASFCDDIVTPYSVAGNLPLIVLCEPFRDDPAHEPGTRFPRDVTLDLPETFTMRWEKNRERKVRFNDLKRTAKMVDSVTFFPSGLFAYSVSFIFDAADAGLNVLDHDLMLVLSAIAKPAGNIVGDSVSFTFVDDKDAKSLPLFAFLRARLSRLVKECEQTSNVFTFLKGALRNAVADLFPENIDFGERISVDIEVLGCSDHARVLECAHLSDARQAALDGFSKPLAGLTQNVLDYEEQDEEEINDSLAGALTIGTDITFVSRHVAVKFCEKSRVTSAMRSVVGGSPYWLLVQLVTGHNEALLADLNADIDEECGQAGMISALLAPKDPHDVEESRVRSRKALKRKIRFAYYIPNLFRYPTEQQLYRFYSKARGLKLRQRYLAGSEAAFDNAVREISTVTKEQTDHTFNGTLIALSVIQLAGVLAAVAAIDDKHFWYFGTHLFDGGSALHAAADLWNGFARVNTAVQPEDFSAVWALAAAAFFVLMGSLYLIPLSVKWISLWLIRGLGRLPPRRTRPRQAN